MTKLGTFRATVTTFHLFTLDAGRFKALQQLVKQSPGLFIEPKTLYLTQLGDFP